MKLQTIILKKVVKTHFTTLQNSTIRARQLTWGATGLLVFLLSCSESFKFCIEGLAVQKKCGVTATRTAVRELQDAGFLKISKIRDAGGRIAGVKWEVSDEPIFLNKNEENQSLNPQAENPHVDFPHAENKRQRNKKEIKNKIKEKPTPLPPQKRGGEVDLEKYEKFGLSKIEILKATSGTPKNEIQARIACFASIHADPNVKNVAAVWAHRLKTKNFDDGGFGKEFAAKKRKKEENEKSVRLASEPPKVKEKEQAVARQLAQKLLPTAAARGKV